MAESSVQKHGDLQKPFRRAVLGGLGVFLPPLLTILCFIWVGTTIHYYVIDPVEAGARNVIAAVVADIRQSDINNDPREYLSFDGTLYHRSGEGSYIPANVYEVVRQRDGAENANRLTGPGTYRRYVEIRFLKPYLTVPLILALFVIVLWLLGKLLAGGLGGLLWSLFERGVSRIPVVRNVYSSVKQVTDYIVRGREFRYTKIVAVEYPRKRTWSLGFVTGESLVDIRAAANEPVLAVLIPTSPMPMTGFTVTVLKSEVVDLNMTMDQALQYIISCGVVVPPHQLAEALERRDNEESRQAALSSAEENGQHVDGNGAGEMSAPPRAHDSAEIDGAG